VTTEDLNIPEFLHRVGLKMKTTFRVGQYLHLQGKHQVEDTNHHPQSCVALKFHNLIIPL
jgi:muramidase (phage lysozyme)